MARSDNEVRVSLSVLDRLIDLEPRESREAPKSRSQTLREMKAAVRRDLEWILNTRAFIDAADLDLEEAKRSVAVYGLPDITGMSAQDPNEHKRLGRALEHAIRSFEPRFLNLKVFMEAPTETQRSVRFKIEAQLDVDPAPEPIAFDTVLQLGSGDFSVVER
ncbi:MAG TPA: type VI secretion system baseplate subunit TssE [Pyrinomonadaceae bacterium]